MLRADGSTVITELVAALIEYEGQPAIQVVLMDVTERERALEEVRARDAELRRAAARLAQAQQIAGLGNWDIDLASGRVTWSDEMFRIFEFEPGPEPSPDVWRARVHPDDRDALERARDQALATRTPVTLTYRLQLPDGRIKHVLQHVQFEIDDARNAASVIGTIQDVTDRELAAAERLALEAQLQHAQRLEALGTMAAGIAHDFNNILTAIIANATLAAKEIPATSPAHMNVAEIQTASARATELVRHILTIGRRQPARMDIVDPSEVIEEVLKLLTTTLPADVEVVARLPPDSPNIFANATQLHQVLVNLCTNAWHALDGRAGRIEIYTRGVVVEPGASPAHSKVPPHRHLEIAVIDNGVGMDAPTLARIFDPFFTTKPVGQGSGLGLSVVHGIVKSHGGVITVTSERGRGTTFRLLFPATDAARGAAAVTPKSPEKQRTTPVRVLLVDDEPAIVSVFTKALARGGFTVTSFTRPEEALAAVVRNPAGFDVVVTDYRMPGMLGLDLSRELRRLAPELPIVLISGNLDEDVLAQAMAAGITRHLGKPCTPAALIALLDELT
jgi:signal transduction histidine kinase